ncbi:MAG: hypothetical protein JXA25_02870 [Anaerolineales bacterium]|nr:hypothetical protein [Anaerolineales bacterium]
MLENGIKQHGTKIPIYTTPGDFSAIMMYPYLYNIQGEWIGWVQKDKSVYNVEGAYVGWITDGPRIVRQRVNGSNGHHATIPPIPEKIQSIANAPLPPMMSELPYNLIDVLEDAPELLHTIDTGMKKKDMD